MRIRGQAFGPTRKRKVAEDAVRARLERATVTFAHVLHGKWKSFSFYRGGHSLLKTLLLWGVWAIRCLLKWPAIVDIPQYGMRLYLLPRWKGCWKAIYVFRERFFKISDPELEVVRQALKPGDVFIDAGAYHGWYALVASKVVGESGVVLAFEPNPMAYATLVRNVTESGRRNIRTFNMALSSTNGSVWLYKGPGDESPSGLAYVPGGLGREQVTAKRLDDVLAEAEIRRVTLMKLDVQGSEVNVLRGAMGAISQSRPLLIFEVDPAAARRMSVSPRAAWDLLAALGYSFFRVSGDALAILHEFPALQEGAFLNIVAAPSGSAT